MRRNTWFNNTKQFLNLDVLPHWIQVIDVISAHIVVRERER